MKKNWQNKEHKDAESFNARRTPRSGGLWFSKGDSKSDIFLIETKTTIHEGYTITSRIWEKIYREALLESKIATLSVEFGKKQHEVVILSKSDFIEILNKREVK